MGSFWLTEMGNVLRGAGVRVVEYDGWKTRARSSGGYEPGRPWVIMWHHTASKTSPANDASYMCNGADSKPIANILLTREGEAWLLAAGATNTNGKGQSIKVSKGTVPADSMNSYAIGIEAANNGVGEAWPQAQIDAYFAVNNALAAWLGLRPDDCVSHQFYAPDRKIDPATAAAVQGPWKPHSVTSSGTWSQDDIRGESRVRAGSEPVPPLPGPGPGPDPGPPVPGPPIGEGEISMVVAVDSNGTAWIGDGMTRFPVPNESIFNNYIVLGSQDCYRFVNTQGDKVSGWGNVQTVGPDTIEALGRWVG